MIPTGIDSYFTRAHQPTDVNVREPTEGAEGEALTSSAYRITIDEGRDSFYALCIEDPNLESAWLMSDTVRSLEATR